MRVTLPSFTNDARKSGASRAVVTPELRGYLCHQALREGEWTHILPDGRHLAFASPAIQVTLRDLYSRGQVTLRPAGGDYLASITWQGIYPLQGHHQHSVSVSYSETIPSGFDLTEALAQEALRACSV